MTDVAAIPQWFGAAVLGAVIAALGYVAKLGVEGVSEWRRSRAKDVSSLLKLASLLHASYEVFLYQRELVSRLEESLSEHHPGIVPDRLGFERRFSQIFGEFTPDEAELHGIIRSMTEHSLRPINQAMSEWLQSDLTYRVARGRQASRRELAHKLNQLDTHLRLWHAKYQAWIPSYPQHALVYLADEESHGLGFPPGLDETVHKVLSAMKVSLPGKSEAPREAGL